MYSSPNSNAIFQLIKICKQIHATPGDIPPQQAANLWSNRTSDLNNSGSEFPKRRSQLLAFKRKTQKLAN